MAALTDQTPRSAKDTASLFEEASKDVEMARNGAVFDAAEVERDLEEEESARILQKDALVAPNEEEVALLLERLQIRLREGRGECLYEVGVAEHSDDAGLSEEQMTQSVDTLRELASRVGAQISHLRTRPGGAGLVSDWLIRQRAEPQDFVELRVAVVGNVDAGKSTLLGVLTHGELDNGRGQARLKLFRHKHEIESGRTSSVGNDILGFDEHGLVVNNPDPHDGKLDWVRICEAASKVITFIDLAGHERYLKTTIFGMTGHLPDYSLLMVISFVLSCHAFAFFADYSVSF